MKTLMIKAARLAIIAGLFVAQAVAQPAQIQPKSLDIFVGSARDLPDLARYEPWVRDLGIVNRLNAVLNKGLPADYEMANDILQLRLTDEIRSEMEYGYAQLLMAKAYNVLVVPTLIFDGKFIVEGPHSVAAAFEQYEQWRRAHDAQ